MEVLLYLFMNLAVALRFSLANATRDCVLPRVPDVDWDMLPGSWYQILNRNDVVEDEVSCYNFRDIRRSPDGLYGSFEEIRASKSGKPTCSIVPAHFTQTGNTWLFDKKYEYLWDTEMDRYPGKQAMSAKFKEVQQFFSQAFVTYTDYDNYLFNMMCGSNGEKYIWVHSRNPYASDREIGKIEGKIRELGHGWSDVRLFISGCRKLTDFACPIYV